MNVYQFRFLSAVGVRETDLPFLPAEVQAEFDRLSDIYQPPDSITRKRCYELAGPFRHSRIKRRF